MKIVGAFLFATCLGFIAASADAQCRTVVRTAYVAPTYAQTYQHQTYQQYYTPPVLALAYQPVYSVGYADQSLQLEFEKLKTQVESFKVQQLQRELGLKSSALSPQLEYSQAPKKTLPLAVPQMPVVSQLKGDHPAVALLTKNCSACHSDAVAKAKGGGFAMFASSGFAPMNRDQLADIADAVFSGSMPKGGTLKDDEVGVVMDWVKINRRK